MTASPQHSFLEDALTLFLGERMRWAGELPLGQPTDHMPGTPEKARVLADRRKRKLSLWHPLDAGEVLWIEERARMSVRVDNGRDTNENQIVFRDRKAGEL